MSRFREARRKIVARLGPLPGLTSQRPKGGDREKTTDKKKNQYKMRLDEKQKLRFYYGLSERQLVRYVRTARKASGATGQTLLQLLEMRLDNIVYRLGIALTIPAARQFINHGHILVNARRVDIPSYCCQMNDEISLSPTFQSTHYLASSAQKKTALPPSPSRLIPKHLERKGDKAYVKQLVDRSSIGLQINELLVVEYYSRQI